MRGETAAVVKSLTNDILIPADAEMTLEGYLDEAGHVTQEGPYGEFLGYYGAVKRNPVFHITAITRRAAGPAKSNSRRWTPKALTLPCCFPRGDWGCLPIPTTTRGSPQPWRAHTTTGFMTFAEPTRPG